MATYYMTPGGAGLRTGLTPENAWGYAEFRVWEAATCLPGDILYVGPGAYVATGATGGARDGTAADRISVIGVGDLNYPENTPVGDDRPLLGLGAFRFWFDDYWNVFNLRMTGTTALDLCQIGSRSQVCNLDVDQAGAGRAGYLNGWYGSFEDCRFRSVGGIALDIASYGLIDRCILWDSPVGFYTGGDATSLFNNLIYGCATAIELAAGAQFDYIVGNTLYDGTTGILGAAGNAENLILRNIISGFTTGANWAAAAPRNKWDYNVWWNNGTDVVNVTKGRHALTVDPQFVDPTTFDFRVRKEALRNLGLNLVTFGAVPPSIYEGGATGIAGITPIDLSGDQLLFDGLETIYLDGSEIQHVLRLEEDVTEQEPTEGVYLSRNVEFHLPYGAAIYPGGRTPAVGGVITDDDNSYVILAVRQPKFCDFWGCSTRAMAIVGTYELDNLATWWPAVDTMDAAGGKITAHPSADATFTDVPAKFMLRPSVPQEYAGQKQFVEKYDVYVDGDIGQLDNGDLLKDEHDKQYTIISFRNRDRIEELSVLECELRNQR